MILFQSVSDFKITDEFHDKTGIKLNLLVSKANLPSGLSKMLTTHRDRFGLIALDSGAYSASTGKASISVYEYALFLKKYGDLFDLCFSLDDRFDDPEHNHENQRILEEALEDKSWKPVPVVHDPNDPYEEFKMYVELGHDYIALGSKGESNIPQSILGKIRKDFPDVKIHVFGTLKFEMLKKHRPESADSTTWAKQAGKDGSVFYWRPEENKSYSFNVGGRDSKVKEKNHIKKSPFY
ncbi:MAG: hypothetical protein WCQ90_15285, partial [Deltaproteobacteria bacterium]